MTRPSRGLCITALGSLTVMLVTACATTVSASSTVPPPPATEPLNTVPASSLHGIHKIQHVIVIVQENRSFDSYFGTYPGADGPGSPDHTLETRKPGPKFRDTGNTSAASGIKCGLSPLAPGTP
jgi:phospholipase C